MTLPAYLACLRALAEKATPGPYETAGAAVVWSPSQKAVIAGASALRATGLVEYVRPEIGEVEQPGRNAAYLAAVAPEVLVAIVAVAEAAQADRVSSADYHNETSRRLLAALDVLAAVAAPRQEDAR